MKHFVFILTVSLSFSAACLRAQVSASMFQYPDVSDTHITFAYSGDIWIVEKTGGVAHKLTTAAGEERFPRFSPSGDRIAFSANYAGNVDVYVMPSLGGMPRRLTYHGMEDQLIDWHPAGKKILFKSSRESGKQRFSQFYSVADSGGLAEKLPIPYGEAGMLSSDGQQMVYTPRSRAFRTWKRYKGGMAADIWLFNLTTKASENIINGPSNDEFPMWTDKKIYFLSDRGDEARNNIWSYDRQTKALEQLTDFSDFDVHFPAIGNKDMVFEAGGRLYLLDLATAAYKEVEVSVVTDEAALMPRKEKVENNRTNFSPAYDGSRAILEARGELFSVPAKNGTVLNLTQTSGVAERYPAWSPNGRYLAYWSDRSGEYELTIRDMKTQTEQKLTSYGPGFRYQIYWSPDNQSLAFIDQTMTIWIFHWKTNRTVKVDQQKFMFHGSLENFSVSWSPDSRYLAYGKDTENRNTAIALYDTRTEKTQQLTSGFYSAMQPVFDPDGKYLYYLTNQSFNAVYSDFDNSWIYPNATRVAAVTLRAKTRSPLAPENDSTSIKEESPATESGTQRKKKSNEKKPATDSAAVKPVVIDVDQFEYRAVLLTAKAGNYGNLAAAPGKVIYQKLPAAGSANGDKPVVYFDLSKREEKTIVASADAYKLTADGKKIIASVKGSLYIVDVAADQKTENAMPVSKMETVVVPREEWRQIFNDTWRFERDFFYDPAMHGVDWAGMRERYGKLIESASSRWDVNFVLGELIGEMNASHTYRGGGDLEKTKDKATGYLGIDWGLRDGAYFVKRIVRGAPWDTEVRSSLDEPGVDVKEGDFILAVNGVMIDPAKDPAAAFEGISDETVELTVNTRPTLSGARRVLVKTMEDETRLRNLEWIEQNRKYVEKASNGRIGYVYVPSTGADGQRELARMFYGQFHKDGLIVDERFNNGGQIPDRFVELLDRKILAYWAVRDGATWQWPPVAHAGPKAMLINGWSGSGGDAFPDYFRKAKLGPLVGTRTWGGLIGISGAPGLIDGGTVTVPTFRMFNPDGTWFREGHGVDPDIEVVDDPTALANGDDPQLQRAVQEVLRQLANWPAAPPVPAFEKR